MLTAIRKKLTIKARLRSARDAVARRLFISTGKPAFIDFEVTDRCSLRCRTCLKWTVRDARRELTAAEWKGVIAHMREWLGPFSLNIGGGEPFLRDDLLDIVAYAEGICVATSVVSNGYNIDEGLADAIIDSGMSHIWISLNGMEPETHDFTRGVKGSHERAVSAIRSVMRRGETLRPGIATILTRTNRGEIPRLVEWVKNEGLEGIVFQVLAEKTAFHPFTQDKTAFLSPRWYDADPLWESDGEAMAVLIDRLIGYKERGYPVMNSVEQLEWMREYVVDPRRVLALSCNVGWANFTVDPYGEARLCYNFGSVGNVLEYSPKALWNSRAARLQRKVISRCEQACRLMNCNFK